MKNLYFLFAILALPILAFAEAHDATTDPTQVKESVKTSTPPAHPKTECQKTASKEQCIEKARTHFNKMKINEDRDHERADKDSNSKDG